MEDDDDAVVGDDDFLGAVDEEVVQEKYRGTGPQNFRYDNLPKAGLAFPREVARSIDC